MTVYYQNASVCIRNADCRDAMREMAPDSIDAVICDPPYGLKFMGKAWDHGVPGPEFWQHALRVAKPGAHLVAFGGTRLYHRLTCAIEDAGWEIRDALLWLHGSGFPKNALTALKPSWEPIVLARKPLAGTIAETVAKYGTGTLNIDACRIEAQGRPLREKAEHNVNANTYGKFAERGSKATGETDLGRWPANVALDEDAAVLLDAQSGTLQSGVSTGKKGVQGAAFGKYGPMEQTLSYGDTGGASRFFYCAKASPSERGANNTHPTVKPIALMQWLCRLITPETGLILDPFMGSGSTGVAALSEGFRFVGVDSDTEFGYCGIALARIQAAPSKQETIFGDAA